MLFGGCRKTGNKILRRTKMNLVEIMQELIKCREQEYLTDEDLAEEIKYWIKEYENKK